MHRAVLVDGLVHADELLEGQPVGTLAAEAEGRVHVLQHVVHLRVVDPPPAAQCVGNHFLKGQTHEVDQAFVDKMRGSRPR